MEKYGRTRQITDDNTARALRLLDHEVYRHTLKFIILAVLHGKSGYANATYCYFYTYNASVVT